MSNTTATQRSQTLATHPHATLVAVIFSSLMVTIDSSTVNVALPHIRSEMRTGSSVTWVVTGYLLGTMAAMPATGWITARWGIRRPFLTVIVLFGAASVLVALAPNLPFLIAARALVGIVGSPLMPLSMTLVTRIYPPERRGWAIAMWSIAAVLGPALGPTIGGRVADDLSWRWLFLGAPPIALLSFALALKTVPDIGRDTGPRPSLDVKGMFLGPPGLCLLVLAASRGQRWGWSAPPTLGCLIAGFALTLAFVKRSLHVDEPLLDLRVLRVRYFVLGGVLTALAGFSMNARIIFIPLEMVDVRQYSTSRIGMLFLPVAFATAFGMFLSGRFVDRLGPRRPLTLGAAVLVIGCATIAMWDQATAPTIILLTMCVHGVGQGLFMGPTVLVSLSHVPMERMAQASTLRQMFQLLGGITASALLGAVLGALRDTATTADQIQHSYTVIFVIVTVFSGVLLLLTLRLPSGPLHR